MVFVSVLLSCPALAAEEKKSDMPWEKAYLSLGVYLATLDSEFRLGADNIGVGVGIDVEDFLGLDTTNSAFRIDAGYRFGSSQRHKMEFNWFRFHREAEKTLTEDVTLPEELGGETILAGVTVSSIFNFDILALRYKYSLFFDERADLNVGVGLFVVPMEFGLGEKGKEKRSESVTAPLPVFSLGFDFAFTPKWVLKQNLSIFYLEFENFKGSILNTQFAIEYYAWKNVALGTGIDGMRVNVEAKDDKDYPGVNFVGSVGFAYFGAQLYVKFYY
jgi:hypothetical protein